MKPLEMIIFILMCALSLAFIWLLGDFVFTGCIMNLRVLAGIFLTMCLLILLLKFIEDTKGNNSY